MYKFTVTFSAISEADAIWVRKVIELRMRYSYKECGIRNATVSELKQTAKP